MTSTSPSAEDTTSPPDSGVVVGQLRDYISGEVVRATPEEVDAVQVMSRRLVEDYGYPRERIQTRPQHRVRKAPSDQRRSYPVDIAVFASPSKTEDELFLIVECKKRTRKDGISQLKLYMEMSAAEIGVWFNGDEHEYIRKIVHPDGRRTFESLPNMPRFGQRIEDIGLYRRKDLVKPSNLKAVFRDLRNHLAGNVTGITRDEALAQEIVNILFCKIYDEVNSGPDDMVGFRYGKDEDPETAQKRIQDLFEAVKLEYFDVFADSDQITIDPESLVYVVGELQNYAITEADRDAVGDAFEVFIGPALRGSEGQFFTPRNVVRMIVEMVNPEPGELLIDPACGSGGFLIMALEHVWDQIEATGRAKRWSAVQIDRKKREAASRAFRGIDKDAFLAKVTKAYMAIIGDGRGGVFCENTLRPVDEWAPQVRDRIELDTFNVVLTNPPFGSKIKVRGGALLGQFDLGHKWKTDRRTGEVELTSQLHTDQPPQLLFLERCLQLLKSGGRLGIVLPESILGNPSYAYVVKWLLDNARLLAVVTLPESLFKTSGKGGTHTKVSALVIEKGQSSPSDEIFMADVKWCGHDSRGNPTYRKMQDGSMVLLDEVPAVSERYRRYLNGEVISQSHLGFVRRLGDLHRNILVPKFYDPELADALASVAETHRMVRLGDLVERGKVSIATGVEVGKMAYGTGNIPFIRTSDISNWELKADPKHGVSEDIYQEHREKLDVQPGDILMVRDGTYLIGTSAILTEADTRILYQSHIYKLRVADESELDSWLLFALLNTPIVKRQVRAMQFTQDIIDTLGNRITELILPVPRDPAECERVRSSTRAIVETRSRMREEARALALSVVPIEPEDDELESL